MPCESTPRRSADTRLSATVAASAADTLWASRRRWAKARASWCETVVYSDDMASSVVCLLAKVFN